MKSKLARLEKDAFRLIKKIGWEAKRHELTAYVVGGFVRDLLLGEKNLDLDIVVEGDAVKLARILAKEIKADLTVYKRFMTATLCFPDGSRLDLATARKEGYAYSGALPNVSKGTIHDDLLRRDFTINSMAVCINPDQFGCLVDDFLGMEDLKKKKIRILHKRSFIDDPTRILRAVRFEQRLGFKIDKSTLALIKSALKKGVENNVKPPRYFEEFKKILKESRPIKCLIRLNSLDAFRFLKKGFRLSYSDLKLLKASRENVAWFKKKFSKSISLDYRLVFYMALLDRIDLAQIKEMSARFNFTKDERKKVLLSKEAASVLKSISDLRMKPSEIYEALKPMSYEVLLFLRSKTNSLRIRRRINSFITRYNLIELKVKGSDLKGLGVKPGKDMGFLLEKLLHKKIDEGVNSRFEELKILKMLLSKKG